MLYICRMKKLLRQSINYTEQKNKDYKRFIGTLDYVKARYPQHTFVGKAEVRIDETNHNSEHHEYWIYITSEISEIDMLAIIADVKNTGTKFTAFNYNCYN